MTMRKIVVVGDKTTTSGVILPNANSTFSVGDVGHKVALIGGQATCLACKGVGTIAKAGGPRRMNFMGEVALENDIVICGCPVPPKLISNLHQTMTYDDQAESQGVVPPPTATSAASMPMADDQLVAQTKRYDEQIKFLLGSGTALAGAAYTLTLDDGSTVSGTTDADGRTERITTTEPRTITQANLLPNVAFCCARQAENSEGGGEGGIDVELSGVKTNASALGSSVIEHKVEEKVRPLTPGEIDLAKKVFGTSVDYSKIKVHNGAYMVGAGSNAMTPNGEMYFPSDYYQADFSINDDSDRIWFIHEMTHVWQYQLGYSVKWGGIKIQLKGGYKYNPGQTVARAYKYDPTADFGKTMSDFNMEQQGDLVSHYFDAIYLSGEGYAPHWQRVQILPFLQSVLAEFIRNPSDTSLLPKTTHIED
ncbi:PAAR domain-containing protein [Collimonas fungivorans]|uniref:Rhs element Vgr protein n=1 Tax=Collimonas fungivorans (strain Ter331) TaxID=1005048 RepID=G0AD77_COLFT|nr:PAAR domain-containing protein [Collimonas fungivorans]AEK63261.1 Rhs element Vgr protein [Collimonas fungivorans Ter331]